MRLGVICLVGSLGVTVSAKIAGKLPDRGRIKRGVHERSSVRWHCDHARGHVDVGAVGNRPKPSRRQALHYCFDTRNCSPRRWHRQVITFTAVVTHIHTRTNSTKTDVWR